MKTQFKSVFFGVFFICVTFFFIHNAIAQQGISAADISKYPQIQELIRTGKITPEEARQFIKAVQKGEISPDEVAQMQEKAQRGELTREEIEAGKALLEQRKTKAPEARASQAEIEKKLEQKADTSGKELGQNAKSAEEQITTQEQIVKMSPSEEKPVLEIFGHKLFTGVPATFDPIRSIPISDDYVVGPGDEIKILMWGRLDATYTLEVDNEGIIQFPKIGPLSVAGLTFGEVKALITRKAEAITGVNVQVSMGRLRTIQVFILGEVKNPGVYTISSLATIANALLYSGGPTELGSLRKVQLKRKGQKITEIDLYDFLLRGDTSKDSRLMPGDVVFVPQVGPMVSIAGNVRRPAIYELKDDKSLFYALSTAGGLKPSAYGQRIQIERSFKNQYQIVLDIPYDQLGRQKAVPLQDGDLIQVFKILPDLENAVYLYGNVKRAGEYAYSPGLTVLDILSDIKMLKEDTYFDYALIKRYQYEKMKPELIPFDLGELILRKNKSQNIPLMPRDEIHIFPKSMFQDREFAVVEGEVRKPGRYFVDQMRIKDLIFKAGDLSDDAYLAKGELIRTLADQSKKTLYFNVSAAMAGDPAHNFMLQDKDQLIIHSIWEKEWKAAVEIKGEVKNKGQYALTEGMRLKDLFFKAGGFSRDAYMKMGHLYRTDWRTKEVTVHTFDVQKAIENNPEHNLLLEDLDSVTIHSIYEYKEQYTVTIKGLVRNPGDYPYAENMRVKDLILISGNVKDGAYMDEAELVRYNIINHKKVEASILNFNVNLALKKDPAHNLPLKPLDIITIKEIPKWWEQKKSVTVLGEVLFPGTYPIRDGERLSSLLERAGGYAEHAYLRGGIFTRESMRKQQQERIDDMVKKLELELARSATYETQQALSSEDIESQKAAMPAMQLMLAKLREAKASGRIVTTLLPVDSLKGTKYDLVLEDGDSIYIPQKPNTVSVLGAVFNPTSLLFEADRPELKYYLGQVGGPTYNAEKKQMYVIRVNGTIVSKQGKNWLGATWDENRQRWGFSHSFENTHLFPGDTVLVPEKLVRPSFLRDAKDITQILYQMAVTTGIVITQVF